MEGTAIERDAALAAEAATNGASVPTELELSSGVVLTLKKCPPLLLRRAVQGIPVPKVPLSYDEDRGREVENPLHPDYQAALTAMTEAQEQAVIGAMILAGTEVKSVPDGFPMPEENEWVDTLETIYVASGRPFDIPLGSPKQRYLAWVQYVAVQSVDDLLNLGASLGRLSGVRELDIQGAMSSFRGIAASGVDFGNELPTSVANGHSVPGSDGGDRP